MLSTTELTHHLHNGQTLLIDGALATELETRGHDLTHALWSGKVLLESPSSIRQVHLDYFLSGANIAITASYQASTLGLAQHLSLSQEEASNLVKRSATLAQEARTQAQTSPGFPASRPLLIAGSVGPYGAYLADGSEYRGDYSCTPEEFQTFHRPRIAALIESGVDLLALETIPSFAEIQALLSLLREEFPSATAWLGCTLRDAERISDGTAVEEVLKFIAEHDTNKQILSFGINCVPPSTALACLQHMRGLNARIPLLCYPNSGETYVPGEHAWTGGESDKAGTGGMGASALRFREAGASLIGGCCRTAPGDIKGMREALERGQ